MNAQAYRQASLGLLSACCWFLVAPRPATPPAPLRPPGRRPPDQPIPRALPPYLLTGSPVPPPAPLPVVVPPSLPPPISGGTLLVTQDDATAVAADPDRDSVWLVDLPSMAVRTRVLLPAGGEPGRAVEDQDGNIHVLLRRGGQVVKINPQSGVILASRPVCPAPRGLAYEPSTDNLYIACAGGELVTMQARLGLIVRTLYLDPDLRDVVVSADNLLVSRFRTAEVFEVDAGGSVVGRAQPRPSTGDSCISPAGKPIVTSPNTAWRLLGLPAGQALMLHQRAVDGAATTHSYSNGGNCHDTGIVNSSVTTFSGGHGHIASLELGDGAVLQAAMLAVDVAATRDGQKLAWISAAVDPSAFPVGEVKLAELYPGDYCQYSSRDPGQHTATGPLIAGAYDGKGQLWLQARNPARLYLYRSDKFIPFVGAEDRNDEGHRLFHQPTMARIACASCHPEAGDDSHVWSFDPIGPRRTQSLRGGLLATAPFHWDGELSDMKMLLNDVFNDRMQGPTLQISQVAAVGQWLDAQPLVPKSASRDAPAAARGQALFNDSAVGCAVCHRGAHFTNNLNVLVGTGVSLQVPSLLDVWLRAPYLHDGCAATLRDRFDPKCGGGDNHGHTSQLSSTQLDDLVAYLETI